MKRTLSIILTLTLLLGISFIAPMGAETIGARPIVTLVQSGFEEGLEEPYYANETDGGLSATITHVTSDDKSNSYAHITERTAGQRSATIQQNVLAQLQANGKEGKYYVSARIKLDTADDSAFALPYLQGNGLNMYPGGGERFEVTDEWVEVGIKNDGSYMAFNDALSALDSLTRCKFYIMMYTATTGNTTYDGDYAIDDIVLWFVPNDGAPEKVTKIGQNELVDGDFEVHSAEPLFYNELFGGTETWFVATAGGSGAAGDRIHKVTIEQEVFPPNYYAHITERTAGQRSATIQQNVLAQLQANGKEGKYYVSARIKLDTTDDVAYALPYLQGNGFNMYPGGGERFEVTDEWVEVGIKSDDTYMAFNDALSVLDSLTRCKFYIMMYTATTGNTTYDGDYAVDDIVLWFVPNDGAPATVTKPGKNELADGNFEAHSDEPLFYNELFGGSDTWFVATADGSGAAGDRIHKVTIEQEIIPGMKPIVHSGTGALYVTNRPGTSTGVSVRMKDIVNEVGALREGEGYYISAWVRADDGQTIEMRPQFGAGAGFVLGGEWITVTDEWTEIGVNPDSTYSMFTDDGGSTKYEPFGRSWASIRFVTKGTENYYIDNFRVMGPEKSTDLATSFIASVETLPAPEDIVRAHEALIISLEETYALIDVESLSEDEKVALATAKATLDAARAAFDLLPAPKNSFLPVFDYLNKGNLIAPYGDLETFGDNDFVWNEENVEGESPAYTLITEPSISHRGNNCLLISNRQKTQHSATFTITEVVRANGAGKYYFSCWMKTKNPNEVMTVMPLLYYGGAAREYYAGEYVITNEWTFVGLEYTDLDDYFRSSGEEMIAVEPPVTYVALRFYGIDETVESANDGNFFPDYYIDDLKFWKLFDGQEDYVDPDDTESQDPDSQDPDSQDPDNGAPQTGDNLPIMILLISLAGAVYMFGITHKKRTNNKA